MSDQRERLPVMSPWCCGLQTGLCMRQTQEPSQMVTEDAYRMLGISHQMGAEEMTLNSLTVSP